MTRNFSLGLGSPESRHCVIVKLITFQTQFIHHFMKNSSASAISHYKLIFYWGRKMYLKNKKVIARYTTYIQNPRKEIKWNDLMMLKLYTSPTRVVT